MERKKRILVVDDMADNIDLITILLKSENYDVVSASNGKETLEKAYSGKFDLIISDILMPVMDGFQFCRECKKDPELAKIYFAFFTATYVDTKDEEFALSLGAQKFIRKPQEPEIFLRLIKELIEKSGKKNIAPKKYDKQDEKEVLKLYNERLVAKLEKKNHDLENEIALHKIAENRLKESEVQFRNLFQKNLSVMLIIEPDTGRIVDANQTAENFYGWTHQQLTSMRIQDINTLAEGALTEIKKVLSQTRVHFEFQHRLANGSVRNVEVSSSIINMQGKELLHSIIQDITERKQAEKILKDNEARYRYLFDQNPVPMLIYELESLILLSVNDAFITKYGYNKTEVLTLHLTDLYPETEKKGVTELSKKLHGHAYAGEWHHLKKDGTKMTIEVYSHGFSYEGHDARMAVIYDITDRKQAEKALQESEKKYRSIFENVQDVYYETILDGTIIEISPSIEIVSKGQYHREELIGKSMYEFYTDSNVRDTLIAKMQKTGSVNDFEVRLRNRDGSLIWCSVSAKLNFNTKGQIEKIIGSMHNISERKQAEKELNITLTKYKTLFDCFPLGITVSDEAGNIVETNPTAEKLLGLSQEEQIKRNIDGAEWQIIHLDGTPMLPDEYPSVQALKHKSTLRNMVMGIVKPDNTITWIDVTAAPLSMEGHGVVITYNDITERKNAEEALQENERMLSTIFNTVGDVIFLLGAEADGNYRFISVNQTFCKITGLREEMIVGKLVADVIPEPSLSMVLGKYRQAIEENSIIRWEEVSVYPTGKLIGDVSVAPVFDDKGHCTHLVGTVHDVTERKQSEDKLNTLAIRQEAILSAVPDIIMEVNNDKVYTWANKAGNDFFGEDVIGKEASFYFEGEQDTYNVVQPLFNGAENVIYTESWQRRKDGEKRLLAWWCRVLKDEKGKVTGALSSARDITERMQAEETISKERTLLKTLIDNLPSGIFVKDKEYRKIIANSIHISSMASHLASLGLNPDTDIIGKTDFEVVPKENAEQYFSDDQKVILNGESIINKEEEGYDPDGKKIWLLVSKIPIKDKEGKINGMVGITTNISELKTASETITKERTLLRTLIDNLPNGVFVKDKEYRKIIVNPVHIKEVKGHLKYRGVKSEIDILGKTDFEVFPKKLAQEFSNDDQKVIRDGIALINNEGIGYDDDGNPLWLLVSKIPLRDSNGEITGLVGVTTDITERRQIEEDLKISEEKFRTIFNNASDGIFLLDPETRKFIMCNLACSEMLGYSVEEFLVLDIEAIHPSEELSLIYEKIGSVSKGEVGMRGDVNFRRKDGSIFTSDLSSTLVTIAETKLVLIVFRDITERLLIETELLEAKEKAEESDKLKTSFLHNISHEIRTPLNGIIGFSDVIANPTISNEKREQFSKIIRQSSDQLLSIVNDIISIATIEAGHEKPNEKKSDINKLLQLIKFQNSSKAEIKNLSLAVSSSLTDNEAIVWVDETKLLQILTNLVSNAIKFTHKGYVIMDCRQEDKFIKFVVKDSGIGIPSEMQEKIFDRFYQIDYGNSRIYGGTGLGLSIVKSYAHFLDGEVHLDSIPGEGSTFTISIPYKPSKQTKPVKVPLERKGKQIGEATILIAEDELMNYELLCEYLSDLNLTIIYAANGVQAVEACKNNPSISLVLMDARMPQMDGYEAARQIKEFNPQLPIVIQSAYIFQNEREKALSKYTDGFLEKPINQSTLLDVLQEKL